MKKSILSILIVAGSISIFPAHAQLLKKIQNAAAQGVENATTNRARESSEKATNNAIDGLLGGMMTPAPTESSYEFSGYMVMEVTSVDKKGKSEDPMKIKYLLSNQKEIIGMTFADPKQPTTTTTSIVDSNNMAIIILLQDKGKKSSMAMKMDYDKIQEMIDDESVDQIEQPDYSITKTGKSKTILGYHCDEYLVKSEDGQGSYWVTEKPIEGFSLFSPQSNPMVSNKTIERYASMFSNAPKGTFMEMIFTDNEGAVTDMKVVEIETSSSQRFQMSEYPNMMAGGK